MTEIKFLHVKTNQEKVSRLCQTVQRSFDTKERLLIAVPQHEVAQYLDTLLWRFPQESFLPHRISEQPCDDWVVITTSSENLNQAKTLINLLPSIHPSYAHYALLYEIFDETDPLKKEASEKKVAFYKNQRLNLTHIVS